MEIDIKRLEVDAEYWNQVAPATATHMIDGTRFVKWENGNEWQVLVEGDPFWRESSNSWSLKEYLSSGGWEIVARPVSAWSGAGIPTVGTVCELDWTESGRYAPAVVRFVGSNIMVVECEGEERVVYVEDASQQLRPIRTQAQRERDDLLTSIIEDYRTSFNSPVSTVELNLISEFANYLFEIGMLRRAGE